MAPGFCLDRWRRGVAPGLSFGSCGCAWTRSIEAGRTPERFYVVGSLADFRAAAAGELRPGIPAGMRGEQGEVWNGGLIAPFGWFPIPPPVALLHRTELDHRDVRFSYNLGMKSQKSGSLNARRAPGESVPPSSELITVGMAVLLFVVAMGVQLGGNASFEHNARLALMQSLAPSVGPAGEGPCMTSRPMARLIF